MIYLDNAATTYPKPAQVVAAVNESLLHKGGNAGRGGHVVAIQAARGIHQTRMLLCSLFGTDDPTRVAFTQNASHALNQALFGLLKPGDHVITSSLEHNAVARPLFELLQRGVEVSEVPGGPGAEFDLEAYPKLFRTHTKLVVTLHASNVTGSVLPIREIGQIAQEHEVPYLLDAAQTAGVLPINLRELPVDILAFPGHKGLLGPQGTGGLIIASELQLTPLIYGGTGSLSEEDRQPDFLPDALESGTLNGPGIAGLGAGVRYLFKEGLDQIRKTEQDFCQTLWQGLEEIPNVRLYGHPKIQDRVPIVAFNIGTIDSLQVSYEMEEEAGIIARAGLHCAAHAHKMLGTIGQGVVRLSPSHFTQEEEIQLTLKVIQRLARKYFKAG